MPLTTQTQAQLLATQVAAVQAGASGLQDFSEGTLLLAWSQAAAEVALWLQALVVQYALLTRAATSQGSDLDTWMADFDITRLPASEATGSVTFGRLSTGAQVVIPIGAQVESSDGTVLFTVIADTTNPNYSSGLGGYVMGASALTTTATVQAVSAGTAGNVTAGAISVISGAIAGISTVTNPVAFTSGANAESDTALRARFVTYLGSLSQGTPKAVETAIASVQTGLDYELVENQTIAGQPSPGYFYVVVDDGSGSPPSSLLTAIGTAINAVRAIGTQFSVLAPQLVEITVAMTITGGNPTLVQAAVQNYINTCGLAGTVEYTKLSAVAYGVSSSVTNVTGVLLNGGTADVVCTQQQRPIVSSVTVA